MPKKEANSIAPEQLGQLLSGQLGLLLSGIVVPPELEAEVALDWCYTVTRTTLSFENKQVSDDARNYWFSYYRDRFLKAIKEHDRHLKKDIRHLTVKSVHLGLKAAEYAGKDAVVSEEAAKQAATDVSCEKLILFPELHWCAP